MTHRSLPALFAVLLSLAPLVQAVARDLADLALDESVEQPSSWAMRPLWWRHVYGGGLGWAGLEVADLDGDGQTEIVAGSATLRPFVVNNSWIVARRSLVEKSAYEVDFRSPVSAAALTALRVAQVDGDPTPEVVAATGAQLLVYDGASRQLQQSLPTSASAIQALAVSDSDGDGDLEYVLCSRTTLYVYDLSGALAWSLPAPCLDLAVGQVDDDAAPEIVIGDGSEPGYVIDGQTRAVEWTSSFGFGSHVRLADVDADGRQEVVAGFFADAIRVFDAELFSLKASVATPLLTALQVFDVEGDGPLEIVYGDDQFGAVHVLDAATLAQKWQIENPDGVTEVAIGDPDGDGVRELLWAGGLSSSGPDHLFAAPVTRRSIEWQSVAIDGPFLALDVARGVGSARRAVLAGSLATENGLEPGRPFYHYASTGATIADSPQLGLQGLVRLRAAQLDADGQAEVVAGAIGLTCFDTLTHQVQWQASLPNGLGVASLALADVDGDGALEAVVGAEVLHSGATGVSALVFDAATGALEWQSPLLAGGSVDLPWLRVAQLDADPQPEIVAGATNGQVYVLDRVLSTTRNLGAHDVAALETPDVDGNGVAEIFVGTSAGAVRRIHPTTGAVLATPFTEAAPVDALAVGDLDGDGTADYATASGNVVRVRSGLDASLLWASAPLGGPTVRVGEWDSLLLAEVDGRGQPELVVNFGSGFVVLTSAP